MQINRELRYITIEGIIRLARCMDVVISVIDKYSNQPYINRIYLYTYTLYDKTNCNNIHTVYMQCLM